MKRNSVLLADDQQISRPGFRELLESEAKLMVVGEAQTGHQAVELARKLRPAVVIMDMAMPLLNGLDATRQICKAVPHCQVLLLFAPGAEAYREQAVDAGAAGFLSNQSPHKTLCRAIRQIQGGKNLFSPAMNRRRRGLKPAAGAELSESKSRPLTGPETEVLRMLTAGKANRETAVALGIGVKTVARHRDQLMEKLTPPDITGLTLKVLADSSARLATGDLSTRTGLAPGKGGLGRLTRTFDQMAQSLERRDAARQEAEKALHVSETRYHQPFKNAQDGILILNASTGKIDDVNPFLINLLGQSRGQLPGNTLWDTGPLRARGDYRQHLPGGWRFHITGIFACHAEDAWVGGVRLEERQKYEAMQYGEIPMGKHPIQLEGRIRLWLGTVRNGWPAKLCVDRSFRAHTPVPN